MNVMKKAWEIAKKGAAKFGGSVKSYFAQSLKMAWVIVKNEAGAVNANELVTVLKYGNSQAYIAVPADVDAKVLNCLDIVVNPMEKPLAKKTGEMYRVYLVPTDVVKVIVDGTTYKYKVTNDGKVFFNGVA